MELLGWALRVLELVTAQVGMATVLETRPRRSCVLKEPFPRSKFGCNKEGGEEERRKRARWSFRSQAPHTRKRIRSATQSTRSTIGVITSTDSVTLLLLKGTTREGGERARADALLLPPLSLPSARSLTATAPRLLYPAQIPLNDI